MFRSKVSSDENQTQVFSEAQCLRNNFVVESCYYNSKGDIKLLLENRSNIDFYGLTIMLLGTSENSSEYITLKGTFEKPLNAGRIIYYRTDDGNFFYDINEVDVENNIYIDNLIDFKLTNQSCLNNIVDLKNCVKLDYVPEGDPFEFPPYIDPFLREHYEFSFQNYCKSNCELNLIEVYQLHQNKGWQKRLSESEPIKPHLPYGLRFENKKIYHGPRADTLISIDRLLRGPLLYELVFEMDTDGEISIEKTYFEVDLSIGEE